VTATLFPGLLFACLIATAALAQSDDEIISAVKIDAKVIPYRVFPLFPQSGYNAEVNLTVNAKVAVFTLMSLQCQFLSKDRKKGLVQTSWVSRSEFKPSTNGQLVAERKSGVLPGGDITDAECRILEVRR
jgi:hypothetical protein